MLLKNYINYLIFFQTIVRGDNKIPVDLKSGIPKTSNVARSNSLRSSSPPRFRRGDFQHNSNLPPSVPEGEIFNGPIAPIASIQYSNSKRDINYVRLEIKFKFS